MTAENGTVIPLTDGGIGKVFLARHGQSTWNAERRWTGHGDPPLTDLGRAQASGACETFRRDRFDAVTSSTLVRASETASIIASDLGVQQLEPLRQLDERFAGEMSGMPAAEIEARWPGFLDGWNRGEPVEIPGGEPWAALVERAMEGLAQLRQAPGRILVITHMGVQRAVEHGLGRSLGSYGNLEGFWVP